jgi:hypothetical protein
MFGEYFTQFVADQQKGKLYRRQLYSCSFPSNERGVKEMVDASNSLWFTRKQWLIGNPNRPYPGWTEAIATPNVASVEMPDAIAITIPPTDYLNASLLNSPISAGTLNKLWQPLHDMYYKNGYRSMPVVVIKQTLGMCEKECNQFWGGSRCEEGYRKEIFSQAINFSNGACVGVPFGCNDAYYFPMDPNGTSCMLYHENASLACRHTEGRKSWHSTPSERRNNLPDDTTILGRNDGSFKQKTTISASEMLDGPGKEVEYSVQGAAVVLTIIVAAFYFSTRQLRSISKISDSISGAPDR